MKLRSFALALALVAGTPVAQAASDPLAAISDLKPGRFVWFEDPALQPVADGPQARVKVVVSLLDQLAYVYRGDRLIGVSTVSTGSDGHETPLGDFTILEKQVFHRSNLYSNAPMPFMQRLTWDGVALHAGQLPGYPASHGCIRLPKAFARQLFDLTAMGGAVSVVDFHADLPPIETTPSPQIAAETHNLGGNAFDVLTLGGPPPVQPAAWVAGAASTPNR
jgi:hypothetical protein